MATFLGKKIARVKDLRLGSRPEFGPANEGCNEDLSDCKDDFDRIGCQKAISELTL